MEINPTVGHGFKIMTLDEWARRWKRNDDFPDCLACRSSNTKEHHFTQVPAASALCLSSSVRMELHAGCIIWIMQTWLLAQTWCRAKEKWESELLCMDCHHYTWPPTVLFQCML